MGFRRVAAISRKIQPDTEIYFIAVGNLYSLVNQIVPSNRLNFSDKDLDVISHNLADADLVCFSSMTPSAPYVEKIAAQVKQKNHKVFILWGGVHCMLSPDEAIRHADAICTGEGEIPFEIFYKNFSAGQDYLKTPGIWFNTQEGITKNRNRSLNNYEELNSFPHLFYDLNCQIYDLRLKRFRNFTWNDYIKYNGLSYRTVWSVGCPFSCIYCANDAFISIDKNYSRIRYASVDYILEEIQNAINIYPFISTVVFYDDNLIGIPLDVLKFFGEAYKKRINLPFLAAGLHPNFITKEKINLLGKAGMNRGRMGIQSGSERTLSFYNRITPLSKIKESAKILSEATRKYGMIPPAYDIISDNPLETRKDIVQTLKFLYELDKPYTLTVFSLRAFPKTKLWDYFKNHSSPDIHHLTSSYLETRKTVTNILFYLLAVVKPPRPIFLWLLRHVKEDQESQHYYPVLYLIVKSIYLVSRGIGHLCKLDFSTIVGPLGYYLWRMGFIKHRSLK